MNDLPKTVLQDLNLLDRFLFARTIEDRETYQALLEILLGEEIHLLTEPQTEKEFRTAPWLRSIRVDVFSMDDQKKLYNTETQGKNTYNLPRRSRYYASLIDSSLLPPGTKDFNRLNDVVQIMIMPFDLFGYGKYRYTFQMQCKEVEGLCLDDGATRIFFNTRGKNKDEVPEELIELLDLIEHTVEKAEELSSNEKIRRIQEQVKLVKSSEEMGVRYMQEWEEKAMLIEEAAEKAKKEADQRWNSLIQKLTAAGRMEDLIRSTSDKDFQEQLFDEFNII